MNTTVTVALIQHQARPNKVETMRYLESAIAACTDSGANLVVLQELHNTAYFCQVEDVNNFDLAESIPGPSTDFLAQQAKQHQCVIVGSVFEKRASGIYHNTAVVLESDGTLAGRYRKMHIPDDPGFYEKFYFTPGDAEPQELNGFKPIETSVGKLGVMVCWDQWYPEAARLMALAGAELLIYPTAIGWDPADEPNEQEHQLDAWITIQRSHAIANNLPVIACNRTGFEANPEAGSEAKSVNGIQFWGNSFIAGQQGEMIATANANDEVNLIASIDLNKTENIRRIWPYLRDRRIDAYHNLSKRYIDQNKAQSQDSGNLSQRRQ